MTDAELIQTLRTQVAEKSQRIAQLEDMLKQARQQRFGSSSEKQSPDQLGIFDEAEATLDDQLESIIVDEPEAAVAKAPTPRKKRQSIPEHLPRVEVFHDLPESEKLCPHDGTALTRIGEETHEQLDIIPAKIQCLRHIRAKYACPCCEQHLITASKPKQPIEKSIAAPGLLAYISVSKYCDGLPLYRQIDMFKRIGVELDRTSLANWMIHCGELVQSLINRIEETLQALPVLHMDETPVQVLKEPDKTAQSKSYMWVMSSPKSCAVPAVLFHYSPSRSGDIPKLLLNDFNGALMVDGYEGYQPTCTDNHLTRLGCWAHARRKFMDAKKLQPKGKVGKADQALSFIQKLYVIEKNNKEKSSRERHQARQLESRPIIDKLKKWLDKALANTPPKSSLGKAASYLNKQWPRLIGYLDDGNYPIDNNRAENSIRPFVIGRKNWLFSASQKGATASANLYSLIETAKLNGIEPFAYLNHIYTHLPNAESVDDIDALLPWNCKDVVG